MTRSSPPPPGTGIANGSVLLFAEWLHRSRNDYARAISLTSLIAARSGSQETRAALGEVVAHLRRTAETQRLLCPPIGVGLGDFAENLAGLCRAMTESFDMEGRGISLLLAVDAPVWLDCARAWRASLVIFELASNACRHAFDERGGRISIAMTATSRRIVCQVSDDGVPASRFEPGLGTELVDALVSDLEGFVERRRGERGTVVTVSFRGDARGDA